jgi:hypothetical protein
MASELWTGLSLDNANNIRKWLYGSVLIRDWKADGSTNLASFTPFDNVSGDLLTNLLSPSFPGGRWYELGAMSENGVSFTPKFTTDDTKIWQSRHPQRTDVSEDAEEIMFSMMESTPLADYLRNNLPLTNVPEVGTANYSVVQPIQTDIIYRQLCVIGVDGQVGNADYIAELRPRVSLTKKGKRDFQQKNADMTELTFGVYPDPSSGFAASTLRGGPFWTSLGGAIVWPTPQVAPVATAVTGLKATISLAQPVSLNDPFTYTVTKTTGGTATPATLVGAPSLNTSTGVVTITVGSLTVSSNYTFTVTATGSNGATGVSAVSNSITAIA